jgi:signal transduction histidine kinase
MSVIDVPVMIGPRPVAVLEVFSEAGSEPRPAVMVLLKKLGGQIGRIVERELWERKLTDAARHEQNRLAGELHDSLAQELAGIKLMVKALLSDLERAGSGDTRTVPEISKGIDRMLMKVRAMIEGMTAIEVSPDGLAEALEDLIRRSETRYGIPCTLTCNESVVVETRETATHLFRIAQEAVQNAVKHSKAEHISIFLSGKDNNVVVEVVDDGVGFEIEPEPTSMGLRFMRYRAERIGAILDICPGDHGGTRVRCALKEGRRID